MKLALFAAGLFATAFFVHWLWWRVRLPKRQSFVLLAILMGTLFVGLAASLLAPNLVPGGPHGFWDTLQVAAFHTSLALAYVVAYSALEERSPSMTLLAHVADAGERGRSRDELYAVLGGLTPIEARLLAMTRDQMIVVDEGSYIVTAKGRVWAGTFGKWRRLIRLNKGG